jgi:hypothetical protein
MNVEESGLEVNTKLRRVQFNSNIELERSRIDCVQITSR